jgi:hypothetical protein
MIIYNKRLQKYFLVYNQDMKQFTINLPNEYYAQFLDLVQKATFPFEIVKVENVGEIHQKPTQSQSLVISELELKLVMAGKMSPDAVTSMSS